MAQIDAGMRDGVATSLEANDCNHLSQVQSSGKGVAHSGATIVATMFDNQNPEEVRQLSNFVYDYHSSGSLIGLMRSRSVGHAGRSSTHASKHQRSSSGSGRIGESLSRQDVKVYANEVEGGPHGKQKQLVIVNTNVKEQRKPEPTPGHTAGQPLAKGQPLGKVKIAGVCVQGRNYLVSDMLGQGGFSQVYRVLALPVDSDRETLADAHNKNTSQVEDWKCYALKICFAKNKRDFRFLTNEIELLKSCRQLDNVIQMYAHEISEGTMGTTIVLELAANGDLLRYLRSNHISLRDFFSEELLNENAENARTPVDMTAPLNMKRVKNRNGEGVSTEDIGHTADLHNHSANDAARNVDSSVSLLGGKKEKSASGDGEDRNREDVLGSPSLRGSQTESVRSLHVVDESASSKQFQYFEKRCRVVRNYFAEMCKGVLNMHGRNIIHSDLKPANFLLFGCVSSPDRTDTNTQGSAVLDGYNPLSVSYDQRTGVADLTEAIPLIKVGDLGLAGMLACDASHLSRRTMLGTLQYMAPESIFRGDDGGAKSNDGNILKLKSRLAGMKFGRTSIRFSADVWSLGIMLFELIYGVTPFAHFRSLGPLLAVMAMRVGSSVVQFHSSVFGNSSQEFERLVRICDGCLVRNADSRWSLKRVMEELQCDLHETPYDLSQSPTLLVRGHGTLRTVSRPEEKLPRYYAEGDKADQSVTHGKFADTQTKSEVASLKVFIVCRNVVAFVLSSICGLQSTAQITELPGVSPFCQATVSYCISPQVSNLASSIFAHNGKSVSRWNGSF